MVGTGSKAQERTCSTRYVLHTAAGRVRASANAANDTLDCPRLIMPSELRLPIRSPALEKTVWWRLVAPSSSPPTSTNSSLGVSCGSARTNRTHTSCRGCEDQRAWMGSIYISQLEGVRAPLACRPSALRRSVRSRLPMSEGSCVLAAIFPGRLSGKAQGVGLLNKRSGNWVYRSGTHAHPS